MDRDSEQPGSNHRESNAQRIVEALRTLSVQNRNTSILLESSNGPRQCTVEFIEVSKRNDGDRQFKVNIHTGDNKSVATAGANASIVTSTKGNPFYKVELTVFVHPQFRYLRLASGMLKGVEQSVQQILVAEAKQRGIYALSFRIEDVSSDKVSGILATKLGYKEKPYVNEYLNDLDGFGEPGITYEKQVDLRRLADGELPRD